MSEDSIENPSNSAAETLREQLVQGAKDIVRYFDWFSPKMRRGQTVHVTYGFIKSFLTYAVPVSLMRRGIEFSTLKRATALGTFVSLVRAVDHLLLRLDAERDDCTELEIVVKKYTLGVATFLSALVALTIDGDLPSSLTFVIWGIVRAFRAVIPEVNFAPTFVMSLSAGQILSTWMSFPEQLAPTYRKFLDHHGGHSHDVYKIIRSGHLHRSCEAVHPELGINMLGCTKFGIRFFYNSLFRSAKVYLPVYVLTFIFSKKRSLKYGLMNLIQSSVFLSTYCTLAWVSSCAFYRYFQPVQRLYLFLHTWIAGLALLIERPSRRKELAAYCLTYAIESVYRQLMAKGLVKVFPSLNTLILSICAGVVMHHHEQQPAMLMKWLFKIGE
eukprot:TRINITY_DN6725_c0_g1_i1.p1 TRINITY_DN6725_c0_g1~~TRINITY_DN6725_c0_g1_i1.p1  ORF type:complete len:385 (+),score=58.20 TRINITY_DN6725_c0_g1_i1:50-1204(+)